MKRVFATLLVVILTMSLLAACGTTEDQPASNPDTDTPATGGDDTSDVSDISYEDGIYFAQQDTFDGGWKYMVTLEVKDGKIADVEWNGAHVSAGKDKITASMDGDYGMQAKSEAQSEWHEQAALAEAYLLETQDPTAITYSDDQGHTDDIAGVSIHVVELFDLAKEALDNGPTGTGNWEDGAYHAESTESSNGYTYFADFTVVNGFIVAASWDATPDEGDKNKKQASIDGEYDMTVAGSTTPWHEQAALAEAYLLETQDPSVITASENTDAIAGVSVDATEFFQLAEEALVAR